MQAQPRKRPRQLPSSQPAGPTNAPLPVSRPKRIRVLPVDGDINAPVCGVTPRSASETCCGLCFEELPTACSGPVPDKRGCPCGFCKTRGCEEPYCARWFHGDCITGELKACFKRKGSKLTCFACAYCGLCGKSTARKICNWNVENDRWTHAECPN